MVNISEGNVRNHHLSICTYRERFLYTLSKKIKCCNQPMLIFVVIVTTAVQYFSKNPVIPLCRAVHMHWMTRFNPFSFQSECKAFVDLHLEAQEFILFPHFISASDICAVLLQRIVHSSGECTRCYGSFIMPLFE